MPAARVLLVVNSKSGTGHEPALGERLRDRLRAHLPDRAVDLAVTSSHAQVRDAARAFVIAGVGPDAIIVGGGSGTLRAAIEGACLDAVVGGALPTAERLSIAPLRMGSGNLVAKALGCVKDTDLGLERAAQALAGPKRVPGTIFRVDAGQRDGSTKTHLGAAMGGFGAFGHVATDVERWPRSFPRARRAVAGVLGIEAWTNLEFGGCILARGLASVVNASSCERVRLTQGDTTRELRLLAGLLFAFRIPEYPFEPGTRFGEGRAGLHVVELPDDPLRRAGLLIAPPGLVGSVEPLLIEPGRDVRIELLDRESSEFFLDEDPEPFTKWLRISIAGTLALVPGA